MSLDHSFGKRLSNNIHYTEFQPTFMFSKACHMDFAWWEISYRPVRSGIKYCSKASNGF